MTCPDPLLGKSLVWSVDENIWLWRFWRSTTRFSRYQSIVLHFGCSCSPPSCLGIFWATFIYQQRKGRESGLTDPWVIHPLKDLELWGETIDGNSKQSGTNSSNNNEIGIPRNIDLKPWFSAEGWRPVKMIQPQDGLCKNFYQEPERVCITRNFSFERKYLRAMWEILFDERHPFKEFLLWKHALCRKEEK